MTQPNQSELDTLKTQALLKSCLDSQIEQQGYGYATHLEMLEKKSKTYDQVKCGRCGKYHLWHRKKKNEAWLRRELTRLRIILKNL